MTLLKKRKLTKILSLEQFQDYKLLITKRAVNRTKAFKDNGQNYYWYRLKELEKIEHDLSLKQELESK